MIYFRLKYEKRAGMADEIGCVELGLAWAHVCIALDRVTKAKKPDDLHRSVREAIKLLMAWVRPVIQLDGSLMVTLVAEPRRRSDSGSSGGANGINWLGFSMREAIRK